jgi:hypothetical protein
MCHVPGSGIRRPTLNLEANPVLSYKEGGAAVRAWVRLVADLMTQ